MGSWADEGISITGFIGQSAALAVRLGTPAIPIIQFIAGFVPGLSPALQVLNIAEPILQKIAAGAPIVQQLIQNGKPSIDDLQMAAPSLLNDLKELYALAVNNDTAQVANISTADVTNNQVVEFTGSVFERSFFTPQDPRFDRNDANT